MDLGVLIADREGNTDTYLLRFKNILEMQI